MQWHGTPFICRVFFAIIKGIKVEFEKSEFSATEGESVEVCATIIPPGPAIRGVTLIISTQDITATSELGLHSLHC